MLFCYHCVWIDGLVIISSVTILLTFCGRTPELIQIVTRESFRPLGNDDSMLIPLDWGGQVSLILLPDLSTVLFVMRIVFNLFII